MCARVCMCVCVCVYLTKLHTSTWVFQEVYYINTGQQLTHSWLLHCSPDDVDHNSNGSQNGGEKTKGSSPEGRKGSEGTDWKVDTESKQTRQVIILEWDMFIAAESVTWYALGICWLLWKTEIDSADTNTHDLQIHGSYSHCIHIHYRQCTRHSTHPRCTFSTIVVHKSHNLYIQWRGRSHKTCIPCTPQLAPVISTFLHALHCTAVRLKCNTTNDLNKFPPIVVCEQLGWMVLSFTMVEAINLGYSHTTDTEVRQP